MDYQIGYGPEGTTLVYVEETGKYYFRVDAGDVSYLFDVPEGIGLSQITGYTPVTKDVGFEEPISNNIAEGQFRQELKRQGKLQSFKTEEEFDGAILEGDLRDFVYVDSSISNIAVDIMGVGTDGEEGYIPAMGTDAITSFLDLVKSTAVDAPWWSDPDYIDEVGKAYIKWGDNGYELFKTYGSTESGESHADILKKLGYDASTFDAWQEYSQDEDAFYGKVNDYKTRLNEIVNAKGGTLTDEALTYAAEQWAWGRWSASKAATQVTKAVDEFAFGELDTGFSSTLQGEGFTKTTIGEGQVRDLMNTWLPESMHADYEAKLSEYAGQIRRNPSFKQQLIEQMKSDRYAMFPQYDKNVAWSRILAGKKSGASRVWGIDANNIKSDDPVLLQILGENKPENEAELLRKAGLERGYAGTMADLNRAMVGSFGSGIVKSAGFTEQ